MGQPIPDSASSKASPAAVLKLKLQIYCGEEIAMGPGKADLLAAIGREGSISAAARAMGMSYRRAWLLVDTMNRCWSERLVETGPGGPGRAGARLTDSGARALAAYRVLQELASELHSGENWHVLHDMLRANPKHHQKD
jgi:molybdate transport system regulatory protein